MNMTTFNQAAKIMQARAESQLETDLQKLDQLHVMYQGRLDQMIKREKEANDMCSVQYEGWSVI